MKLKYIRINMIIIVVLKSKSGIDSSQSPDYKLKGPA
jgi:hypothetical protein